MLPLQLQVTPLPVVYIHTVYIHTYIDSNTLPCVIYRDSLKSINHSEAMTFVSDITSLRAVLFLPDKRKHFLLYLIYPLLPTTA